ncbi:MULTISPECIES: cytochrome c oxidase accessory protein CcoG [unclassified Lentimicrobium]|uniref:cytochrome c oxidase accessory protein CcoG n=1 Tax=unclassified Lentimicrobium TaxID=2677434 RepID=UPI001554CBF8|nr:MULTISPECIES: cytochrome c oxidase accessory protein CcoG [unclassified Lentimicrobium]NPD46168.1 cytochrome c oxidase accessory protein CcoG [Lentimicrobium sp. S6]NPD83219.1 cytochrome c oxidase accessory protein CcoG [Lentimicrobium sp. L6]
MSEKNKAETSFRDSISTIDNQGKRIFVHPKKPKGRYFNRRRIVGWALLLNLFLVPFIKVNGHPLFLFDVIQRKFILFGVHFWPQDSYLFAIGMISLLVGIVLFTAVYGRLWCGWTCPQTVFMEILFRPVEYLIDGDANEQRKLKDGPWSFEKVWKRIVKNGIFVFLSILIANALLSWVVGVDELFRIASEPISEHIVGFGAMLIFSGVLFFIYSWFREQVCSILCPYGRIQGVLLDVNSIIVSYDYKRGEPRGNRNDEIDKGDCIDCGQCVQVCPTGIDIRNGSQLECINCTACIDACDGVMDKVKKPRGLIRFASEKEIVEGAKFKVTPRMIGYSSLLVGLMIFFSVLIFGRADLETSIFRTPGMLYQEQEGGRISNLYNFKIINKTIDTVAVELKVLSYDGEINVIRGDVKIKPSSIYEDIFFVYIDPKILPEKNNDIEIGVFVEGEMVEEQTISFIGDK